MPKPLLYALIALAAAAVVAGCGGDDESTTTAASGATGATGAKGTISKAQWIQRADAICEKGDRELQRAQAKLRASGAPSEAAIEKLATDKVIPTLRKEAAQIRALPTPEGDGEQVNAILDAVADGIHKLEQDPSLVGEGDDAGGAFSEANKLARRFGLERCGG